MNTPADQMRALGGPFMGAFADMIEKGESNLSRQAQDEAARTDSYFDRVPVLEPLGVTGLIRHAVLRTGFSYEELELMVGASPGSVAAVASGKNNLGYLGGFDPRPIVNLVNASRYVEATFPGMDLRSWWTEKRHGKRLSPLDLVRRLQEPIFDPYRAELTVRPQTQLLGNICGPFFEAAVYYLDSKGLTVG
jgi:hypothetical protein